MQDYNKTAMGFIHFDMPSKTKPIKASPAFMSTSRDAWDKAHASRTNPPDGLKFRPKYDFIWEAARRVKIHKPQENVGKKRILEKNWQHAFICDRITKTMNDKNLHEKVAK